MPTPLARTPFAALLSGPGRRPAWRRRVLRRCAAATLAAVAVLVLIGLYRPPAPEPRVDVVVAARALPAGALLAADDVRTASVPASLAGAAGSSATAKVVGRVLAGAVEEGEPLRASRLVGPDAVAPGPGRVVVGVPVASRSLVAALRVGAHVDVVAGGEVVATAAPVLAVSASASAAPAALGVSEGAGEVLVSVERGGALRLAQRLGGASPGGAVLLLR